MTPMTPVERSIIEAALKIHDYSTAIFGLDDPLAEILADAARRLLAMTTPEFAERLATNLFTEGSPTPRLADRLVMEFGECRGGSGLCREAVRDRIRDALGKTAS